MLDTPERDMTIRVRSATADDADAVSSLSSELGHPVRAVDVPSRLSLVHAAGGAVMLAVDGERALALMCLARLDVMHAAGPVAYITALVITADSRGRGIGRMLVDEAMRWARANGCERISVTSAEHRADAHAFYPRCGLPYTGRRFSALLAPAEPTHDA